MDIEAVKMFVMLANKLNFTETAKILQISQPTLSRKIKSLENSLSVTLIHRSGGSICLTPQGEIFLDSAYKLLAQIEKTIERVQNEKQDISGIIRIGCLHPMSSFLVNYFIADFHQRYPEVRLYIKTMIPSTLNSLNEVDIMIAPFLPPGDAIVAKPLPKYRRYCYASPSYLDAYGVPQQITDLEQHLCVTKTNDTDNKRIWVLENSHSDRVELNVDGLMAADSVDITIELVKKGFGIGLISNHKAIQGVEEGSLIQLFNGHWFYEEHMYLIFKQNAHTPKRFKVFMDEFTKLYSSLPLK
ncbi:LysR family transcriptional regulator [Vibrio sp. SS-MA-C1-2]|uniref:LysR family transcriptional regulator n=1 Tax=Vibrio sp. SS-MA-C1-2 TaxID=2908646 RepID=UPI001F37135B|nr:LysR family transcriptional regulator [Vibrio sp. SS-MA-C1-2]UJF17284.1 LysR family transcriptional regulator [Vibrio sp. SS-MA-C1-2]